VDQGLSYSDIVDRMPCPFQIVSYSEEHETSARCMDQRVRSLERGQESPPSEHIYILAVCVSVRQVHSPGSVPRIVPAVWVHLPHPKPLKQQLCLGWGDAPRGWGCHPKRMGCHPNRYPAKIVRKIRLLCLLTPCPCDNKVPTKTPHKTQKCVFHTKC